MRLSRGCGVQRSAERCYRLSGTRGHARFTSDTGLWPSEKAGKPPLKAKCPANHRTIVGLTVDAAHSKHPFNRQTLAWTPMWLGQARPRSAL